MRIDGVKQKGVVVLFYRAPGALKIEMKDAAQQASSPPLPAATLSPYTWPRTNHYMEGPSEDVLRTVTGVDLTPYGARTRYWASSTFLR